MKPFQIGDVFVERSEQDLVVGSEKLQHFQEDFEVLFVERRVYFVEDQKRGLFQGIQSQHQAKTENDLFSWGETSSINMVRLKYGDLLGLSCALLLVLGLEPEIDLHVRDLAFELGRLSVDADVD